MIYPEKVEVRKGYFPETANGLEDDGVILVHDYYNPGYIGIKNAIEDYEKEIKIKLRRFPIGDHCSIAIMK